MSRVYSIETISNQEGIMQKADIITMLQKSNAMLEGHFMLSSGLHSRQYLQCALLLSYPRYATALCKQIAQALKNKKIDIVIGPAYGGIILAYELARALGARAMFTERKDNTMQIRRGFAVKSGQRVLIAEDVITTGKSVKEVIATLRPYRPDIVAIAALIDRSNKKNLFNNVRLHSAAKINIKTYSPETCPLCKAHKPLEKPGSRLS